MKLKVLIYGVCFSVLPLAVLAAASGGLVPCGGIGQGFCSFCDLFKLIGNVFQFIVGTVVPIIAVAMAVWGGYKILTAGFNPDQIKSARQMLYNTFIGLIIVYGSFVAVSYVIGFFAKSNKLVVDYGFHRGVFTVNCTSNAIQDVTGQFSKSGVISLSMSDPENGVQKIDLPNVSFDKINNIAVGNADINDVVAEVKQGLQTVSQDQSLKDNHIGLSVVSGKRTLDKQQAEVAKNCPVGATRSKQCTPETCVDGDKCPHVAGVAVDVHGVNLGADGKPTGQCANASSCQQEVIKAMKRAGFCVLDSESWHFEKPKVSKNCN